MTAMGVDRREAPLTRSNGDRGDGAPAQSACQTAFGPVPSDQDGQVGAPAAFLPRQVFRVQRRR